MKQDFDTKAEARERVRQYEASMAIEGIEMTDRDRAVIDSCIEDGLTPEETQARIVDSLKADGLIPADEATIAAE
ncbi:MAG: antitoxin VbhA family protein [Pseudomonadota bacterium]